MTASADFREGFEPPPHRALAIAKVLERGEEQQPEEVAKTAIAAEAHFLQHDRPNGKQHAVAPGDEDEEERERDVHETKRQSQPRDQVTDELDHWRQHLSKGIEGHREESNPAIARIEEHGLVLPYGRDQTAMPSLALP